jgi:hypothetical protein
VTGLEPATSGVTGRRSNQLSYTRVDVEGRTSGAPWGCQQACPAPRQKGGEASLAPVILVMGGTRERPLLE